jgi:hypothetical protein
MTMITITSKTMATTGPKTKKKHRRAANAELAALTSGGELGRRRPKDKVPCSVVRLSELNCALF